MADDGSHPPEISISRTSSASSKANKKSPHRKASEPKPSPKINTDNKWNPHPWFRGTHTRSWENRMNHNSEVEWHIKWTKDCFPEGRVLIIDYISNKTEAPSGGSMKRHVGVAAQEFQTLQSLHKFYADSKRVNGAALRVIHVQNATWATNFLLRKFNIDHDSEMVGMQGFSRWASYKGPRQRNGKPFPNGRSWREQTDPWRNVSRTAFGLDYLKTYETLKPSERSRHSVFGDKPIDAHMMHLNTYEDSRCPDGYDISVQRMNVYVQRNLGPPRRLSPEENVKNPYSKQGPNGYWKKGDAERVDLDYLDNSNTVIVFETSASMLMEDCLIQPRNEIEKRWRRLSFYLKREDVTSDARLAAQCMNMILSDVFHGLAVGWQEFLAVGADHVNKLEDKIYDNPADESRAPELWTNQAAWLKVDKVMWIHQDLIKEMQGHLHDMGDAEMEEEPPMEIDWLNSTPAEYERLAHSVQEDLVQPTTNLSDLMYKSVGIRDSRQSLQLGLSMWRLSWITFIFLPLTFIVSFFGMNVNIFAPGDNGRLPSVGWYFLAASILMILVLILWYCVKHSLQRRRQTPFQRGLYENLFNDLEDRYPLMWSRDGAIEDVEPADLSSKTKWNLLKRWFAPDKTINKRMYSSLGMESDEAGLGSWERFKEFLLFRWLPQIRVRKPTSAYSDTIDFAEQGLSTSAPASIHYEPGAVNELAKMSTPIAIAEAEPSAIQQISTLGLRPLREGRRSSSVGSGSRGRKRYSEERPSSRGSSGIMFEERNLSDSESDAGEGASSSQEDQTKEESKQAETASG